MRAIKATWTNGRILPSEPVNWPEGSELLVEPVVASDKIGLDESEWRDDEASLADWQAWLPTVEALELTPDEQAAHARFADQMRQLLHALHDFGKDAAHFRGNRHAAIRVLRISPTGAMVVTISG
jgi:hypothetical protein